MANLFLNFIYSLTAGLSSAVSHVQNFIGGESTESAKAALSVGKTAGANILNQLIWGIEQFILGIVSALEFIAYQFLGIGQGIDSYAKFAEQNNLTSSYTRTYRAIVAVAIVLMIIFTIFAIIRQEWVAAHATGTLNPKNNNKTPIIMRLLRGIVTIIVLPATLLIAFGAVNSVLNSFNRALQGRTKSTIATSILATASYNSNRYNLYVEQDVRVPIVIQAYDPSEYKADEKEELAYKIKSTDVQNKLKSTALSLQENTFTTFSESLTFSNNKLTNSSKFGDYYESFVCTPEQYRVMADFVNYAELTQDNFYIRAVDDDSIEWKFVDDAVYNSTDKSLTINYRDASNLNQNNGLNTASAASKNPNLKGDTYTITYSLGYDISSPISDAYKTMEALLGIGDYSDVLYNKLEREDDSVNVVHWASKKVSIHFSKNFVRDNPKTWTATDEIIMYEYYHFAVNNTLQNYTLEDLEYKNAVENKKPVTLDAKIYTYRKYYAYADAYSPEIDVDCVYINGNYYVTELSETEQDEFGNPYYVLKSIEGTNFLTTAYTTIFEAENSYANIQLSSGFNINDPYTWTYSDQVIMYEYYKDLSYNNEWSIHKISDFKQGISLPVYVIALHSDVNATVGSSQFYVLINGVYYEVEHKSLNNSNNSHEYKLFSPTGVDFLKNLGESDTSETFYKYAMQLKDDGSKNGISTETSSGKTAENFLFYGTGSETNVSINSRYGGYTFYYYADSQTKTEVQGKLISYYDKDGIERSELRDLPVATQEVKLKSGNIEEALEYDNFEAYESFDLKFSRMFDYKDVNTWNYRDYFIFYLYSKYLAVSGINLSQLQISGGIKGEICRVGVSVNNSYKNKVDQDESFVIQKYDYDKYGNPIVTDMNGKLEDEEGYTTVIDEYIYLYRIDPVLLNESPYTATPATGKTNNYVYLRIDDVLNISQANVLNPLNVDTTYAKNNFDKAYENNLFIDVFNDADYKIEFTTSETAIKSFGFSSSFIYDSQNTWTVGDFILLYLNEEGIINFNIDGSLVDKDNLLKEYTYGALNYLDKDTQKYNFYKFGSGSSALYLSEIYIVETLKYSNVDAWWNDNLFSFISTNAPGGESQGSSLVDDTTIANSIYFSKYSSSVKYRDDFVKEVANKLIFNVGSSVQLVKNSINYVYYNSGFDAEKIETWTVLDGIINTVIGSVEKRRYAFETAYRYDGTSQSSVLCLMITDTQGIELTTTNVETLGLKNNIIQDYTISSTTYGSSGTKTDKEENYSRNFGLIEANLANIIVLNNMDKMTKQTFSSFSYTFASTAQFSYLDCLLIDLHNNNTYKNLAKPSEATYANSNKDYVIIFDIYSMSGESSYYYLHLGNDENGNAYFFKFRNNNQISFTEVYNITCSNKLFTKTDRTYTYSKSPDPNQEQNNDITNDDKYTLLDAIICHYTTTINEQKYDIYKGINNKEYISVNKNFIEYNSKTTKSYQVNQNLKINGSSIDNTTSTSENYDTLIKSVYNAYYNNTSYVNPGASLSNPSNTQDVRLFDGGFLGLSSSQCSEVENFRLNKISTWTPLNVILYNLGLITSDGNSVSENKIDSAKVYTFDKVGRTFLQIQASQEYKIDITNIGNVIFEEDNNKLKEIAYNKYSTFEVYLKALYEIAITTEEKTDWLTFDNMMATYTNLVKTAASLKLTQTKSLNMNFEDLSSWDLYSLLYYYYNKELPSDEITYVTYGEYGKSDGYIKIKAGANNYLYFKLTDLNKTVFAKFEDSTLKSQFGTSNFYNTDGKPHYKFNYNVQGKDVSSFGVVNYYLTKKNTGDVVAYKLTGDSKVYYQLTSTNYYLVNLNYEKINIDKYEGVEYSGGNINSKNIANLTLFDLYIKSISGTVTSNANTIIRFGTEDYLVMNNKYINLAKFGIYVSGTSKKSLSYSVDNKVTTGLKINMGKDNSSMLLESDLTEDGVLTIIQIPANLPKLPGMIEGSTIVQLKFSEEFDYSNYETWSLSDFILYYIFVENNFNYSQNKEKTIQNFQEYVTKGYVEATYCNVSIIDSSDNAVTSTVLIIGQSIFDDEFDSKLYTGNDETNAHYNDIYKYYYVDYNIFYELYTKKLMNIYTYSYTPSTAPLWLESIGASANTETTSLTKFGVTFIRNITSQDLKYYNYHYFDFNTYIIEEYFDDMGVYDLTHDNNSGDTTLIDLKLSSGFKIDQPDTWTILDYIVIYEFSRDIEYNAFEGLTFLDLQKSFLYELRRDEDYIILDINGNKYNLTHWFTDKEVEKFTITENLFDSIRSWTNNPDWENEDTQKQNPKPAKPTYVTPIVHIDITSNSYYDVKVLVSTYKFNILIDTNDIVSEIENTLITDANTVFYKLLNISSNEEFYVSKGEYATGKYSEDEFKVIESEISINDTMLRSNYIEGFANKNSKGSTKMRVELVKMPTTLMYIGTNNNINWKNSTDPNIINDYYLLINNTNGENVYVHRDNINSYTEVSGGLAVGGVLERNNTKFTISSIPQDLPTSNFENGTESGLQDETKITFYRKLDKNVYFNYQISLTRYKSYMISTNILKVNWPQKLLSDMMTIYPDLNWSTLLATDGWIDTLGDYHSGTASGQYITSGNSANITAVGMVLSEFLLSIATKPSGVVAYADYEYESIYDSETIKALMLSLLGEEEYDRLVNEANIFVDFFNVGFAGVLDSIAEERDITIKEGKVDGFEMSLYKSYLSTAILSSDFAEYLYTVATRVLSQYTIYEPLARSANDYDTYYAYFNGEYGADGEIVNAFSYGSFRELVEYENQSLKYGYVPMFTFNLEYVRDQFMSDPDVNFWDMIKNFLLDLLDFSLADYINGQEFWSKMIRWYESYYEKIYLTGNLEGRVSQDDPMYCYMFDVYYSIVQSIKQQGQQTLILPEYLQMYKDYIDGDVYNGTLNTEKRWEIVKDVSINSASVSIPDYLKYIMYLQIYKAKNMGAYLDFMLAPLYTPFDAIQDGLSVAKDVSELAKDVVEDSIEGYAAYLQIQADLAAMNFDLLFNQDDMGSRAADIANQVQTVANNAAETAQKAVETAESIAATTEDALCAILSLTGSITGAEIFTGELFEDYLYVINPANSFIFFNPLDMKVYDPYGQSEGLYYMFTGSAGVVEGWEKINTLYEKLEHLMEGVEQLYDLAPGESYGDVHRTLILKDRVIDKLYDKFSNWYNGIGSYLNIQNTIDRVKKGSITFTLAQYTNNYKEEGYNFTIQNKNYKLKTAVSTQRIGEYVYGGEFLEHFGIPATYTSSTFTGAVDISTGYETSHYYDLQKIEYELKPIGIAGAQSIVVSKVEYNRNKNYYNSKYDTSNLDQKIYNITTRRISVREYQANEKAYELFEIVNDDHAIYAKKAISSFNILREFASTLANYTGKLYLLSNVMDLSSNNDVNPVNPAINNTDSVLMTDYIYAKNPLKEKIYANSKSYILTTQEYLIIDFMLENMYLSYDTFRSLLLVDTEETLEDCDSATVKSVLTPAENFNALGETRKIEEMDKLRYYLAYVQSDNYSGNYTTLTVTTPAQRIHTIFKKVILYLTNMVEDNSNGFETTYEGKTISFDNMYFQKLRLTLIEALVDFKKNDTDTGEANANRYLSLYNLTNAEFDYYYDNTNGEKYGALSGYLTTLASDDTTGTGEKEIGRRISKINNSLIVNGRPEEESNHIVEYYYEGSKDPYSLRAQFRIDKTTDGLFKKLAGVEHRPVEELVKRQYDNVYTRNGYYDEELGDTFICCTYDEFTGKYYPILAYGDGYLGLRSDMKNNATTKQEYDDHVIQLKSNYVKGSYAYPVVAKGIILDGTTGYLPTAIKMVNNEVIFYRDAVTVTGDLSGAITSGVTVSEVSTSKYTKYVTSSTFSNYGDAHVMYIGANNPTAYVNSDLKVTFIQYTTNYTINTEDEYGAISVLGTFTNYFKFDAIFHLLMLLGYVTMIPIIFKAILLGMRRMLDLMALVLVAPLAISMNSLQTDDKGSGHPAYTEWKRMFMHSLLSVFGIVVSFNLYYILVNTAMNMTYIVDGDATMLIIADSPFSFIPATFMNALVKFFFVIIASSMVESGGKLIGRIITGGDRVNNAYASAITGQEPMTEITKMTGDVKKAVNLAQKAYSGELLQDAMAHVVEMAAESIPGSAIMRRAMDRRHAKNTKKQALTMANQYGGSKAAKDEAIKYAKQTEQIRAKKRELRMKRAQNFSELTGATAPQDPKFKDQGTKIADKMEKQFKREEALQEKAAKKLKKVEDLHAKGKLTRQERRKQSIDRLDKSIRENGVIKGVGSWVKTGIQKRVHKAKESVKNAAKKTWGTLKSLPGKAWNGIKTGVKAVGHGFKKAGLGVAKAAKATWGAMKKAPGAIAKGIKAVPGLIKKGAGAVAGGVMKANRAVRKGFKKAGQGVAKAFKASVGVMTKVKDATISFVKNFPQHVKKAKEKTKEFFTKKLPAAAVRVKKAAKNTFKKGANYIKNKAKARVKKIKANLKSVYGKTLIGRTFGILNKGRKTLSGGFRQVKGINRVMRESNDLMDIAKNEYNNRQNNQ